MKENGKRNHMKIMHLTHTDIRSDSRILKQINSLSLNEEYKIIGFGIKRNIETINERSFRTNVLVDSFPLRSTNFKFFPKFFRHFLVLLEFWLRVLKEFKKHKPGIVHCHDTLILPLGMYFKKFYNVRLIYDAHELESHQHSKSTIISKFILLFEKFCWTSIDLFISVSDSIINWYHQNLGEKDSILILNSPSINLSKINSEIFNEIEGNYLRNKFNIREDELIFIYVGLMTYGRGINDILNIFENRVKDSHIVFLGYGDLKHDIELKAQQCTNIHYHPPVKHNEVVSFAKSADVGLCLIENDSLSYYYCLPNKLFEYAFAGIPVLASDFPELKKTIDKYNLGMCCENSVDSIVKTIERIEKENLTPIHTDLSDLSWEAQEDRLLKAYENLI